MAMLYVTFAFTWAMRNWKIVLATLAAMAIGFVVHTLDKRGYQRRVSEEAAYQVKVLQARIETIEAATVADAARASRDAEYILRLETLANETPPNSAQCLDGAAARRLRAIK